MKLLYKLTLVLATVMCFQKTLIAAEKDVVENDIKRVGGIYVVKSITKKAEKSFVIEFEAVAKNGKGDLVRLESEHVHVGVEEGHSLRISAEIAKETGATVDASQVLIFIPRPEGAIPVWMLSKNAKNRDLRGSKYLEMHAPQSDYVIM